MMKKLLPKLLLGATGVWVGSMLIYWFNLDNKAIYLGSREGVEYMTDGGLVFGTDFDDKSMPDMNVKVIGWREIM